MDRRRKLVRNISFIFKDASSLHQSWRLTVSKGTEEYYVITLFYVRDNMSLDFYFLSLDDFSQ